MDSGSFVTFVMLGAHFFAFLLILGFVMHNQSGQTGYCIAS